MRTGGAKKEESENKKKKKKRAQSLTHQLSEKYAVGIRDQVRVVARSKPPAETPQFWVGNFGNLLPGNGGQVEAMHRLQIAKRQGQVNPHLIIDDDR